MELNKAVMVVIGLLAIIGFFSVGLFPTLAIGGVFVGGQLYGRNQQKQKQLEFQNITTLPRY